MYRNGNNRFFKNGGKMTGESGTLTFQTGETRKCAMSAFGNETDMTGTVGDVRG
jgi:hypothetical protein